MTTETIKYEDRKAALQERLANLEKQQEDLKKEIEDEYEKKHAQLTEERNEKVSDLKSDIKLKRIELESELRGFEIAENANKGIIDELTEENELLKIELSDKAERINELFKSMLESIPDAQREGFERTANELELFDSDDETTAGESSDTESRAA